MTLLSRLVLLFVGVPLLELFILIQMGRLIGLLPTIVLVIVTGLAGATLARLEGLRTLWNIRGELARGRLPGNALFDGLGILVGGALLLTPGILTDLLGFSFLFPPTRTLLLRQLRSRMEKGMLSGAIRVTHFSGFGAPEGFDSTMDTAEPQSWPTGSVLNGPTATNGEIIVEAREPKES